MDPASWTDFDTDPEFTSFPTQLTEPAYTAVRTVSTTIVVVAAVIGGIACIALIGSLALVVSRRRRRRRRNQLAAVQASQTHGYYYGDGGEERADTVRPETRSAGLDAFEISPYEAPAPSAAPT